MTAPEEYPDWYKKALAPEPEYNPETDNRQEAKARAANSAIYNSQPNPRASPTLRWKIGHAIASVGWILQMLGWSITRVANTIRKWGESLQKI